MLEKVIQSSHDPKKVSLAVRGALLMLVPIIVAVANVAGMATIDEVVLRNIIDAVTTVVEVAVTLVSVAMVAWGLLRKLWSPKNPEA